MKYKVLIFIMVLFTSNIISYYLGIDKSYEVTCRMSDFIRCYQDHLTEDTLIQDWGCFDDLYVDFLYDNDGKPIDISKYSWCY